MAAGMLSLPTPQLQLLCSSSFRSKLSFRNLTHQPHQSWLWPAPILTTTARAKMQLAVAVAMQEPLLSSSSVVMEHISNSHQSPESLYLLAESVGYSLASYYTSLGLFVISVPGLWSLIKRSVKSKIVQKTFIGEGESKKSPNQAAGEILSFFTRNNFAVTDRGETIT